jgi:tetratricopeptide (TPR) repeat protein
MAAVYLDEVLRVALEEQHLDESHPDIVGLRLRLAYDEWHAGNLFDAITQYTRAWVTMTKNGDDNDTLITTAKQLGDLYTRVGDLEKAEEYLTWAFYAVTKDDNDDVDTLRKINVLCSLASLYAVQRQFHLALPLFLQALQAIPKEDDDQQQWLCTKAILQNQLAETFYGMGKSDEAMGWAQAALDSSSDGMAKYEDAKDCRECGGVVSNNLGKLLEVIAYKRGPKGVVTDPFFL